MSREIKFRGYVKNVDEIGINVPHEGHFVYGDLVHSDEFDYIVGGMLEATDEYSTLGWWQAIPKGTAEQFTGLKDKNGKDIYEGDIVQFRGNSDDLAIVKFGEFGVPEIDTEEYVDVAIGFYYEPKGSLSNVAPFNMTVPLNKSYANLGEIIGNIHENPELVEADDRFD